MEIDDDVSTAALTDGGDAHNPRLMFPLPSQNDGDDDGGHGQNDDDDEMMAPLPSTDDEDDDTSLVQLAQGLQVLVLNGLMSNQTALLTFLQIATMPLVFDLDGGGDGGFVGVPASAAAVADLEKQVFEFDHHGEGGGNDEEAAKDSATGCVICIEEFVAGDEVCAMPCSGNHSFHRHCITEWLGRSNVCPLCRHPLPVEEQDEGIAFFSS